MSSRQVAPAEWVVRPGDDLWSIAAATLRTASGGEVVAQRVVATYWIELIEANRKRLTDPNLIFPGQVVTLPPVV